MHILYDLKTLDVQCVMYECHECTAAHNRTLPNHVEHDERMEHHEIHLDPHPTELGKVVVSRKQTMDVTFAGYRVNLGGSALLTNVPEGTEIRINEEMRGTMDDSHVLEFTPETSGHYHIQLLKRGFHTEEFTVEAHS